MGQLILNGIYDKSVLKSLDSAHAYWGFDFRATSPQFIPFHQFKKIASELSHHDKILIILQDESTEVVKSLMDMIQKENFSAEWSLQFRDKKEASFYQQLNTKFSWVFHPEASWREIMSLEKLESVILPVEFADLLEEDFWTRVDARGLNIILHFNNFEAFFRFKNINKNLHLSIDFTSEIELSYRKPNQVLIQSYMNSLSERRSRGEADASPAH